MFEHRFSLLNPSPTPLLRQVASFEWLHSAWRKVRANRGAAGIDAVSVREFERNLMANLSELSRNLLNKTYEPLPARPANICKSNGELRELAIPTVRDRVAQRAVLDAIDPIFEPNFLDCSFAFRTGRSVAMAIQQVVVARAQGLVWMVDTDIEDFFPSIDHKLLLANVAEIVTDQDLLILIEKWLNAGLLETQETSATWLRDLESTIASAQLSVEDCVSHLLDEYVADKLRTPMQFPAYNLVEDTSETDLPLNSQPLAPSNEPRRVAIRRLVQDGLLLAIAERAALRSLLGLRVLGIGGAALALAALTPTAVRTIQKLLERKTGALQGGPISPLLSNIYLHPFDQELTGRGFKLTRYCDDFLIACRSEEEAKHALKLSESMLSRRRLRLNPEKTRIVAPGEEFVFLGYHFTANGRVIAPPSTTDALAKEVMRLAERSVREVSYQLNATPQRAKSVFHRLKSLVAGT